MPSIHRGSRINERIYYRVLNLVISGLPSIPIKTTFSKRSGNLIITGIPSIPLIGHPIEWDNGTRF